MKSCAACILALIVLSVNGLEVVARVHFTQAVYTVQEGLMICVDVRNDLDTTGRFTIGYTFSAKLLGRSRPGGGEEFRTGTMHFRARQRNAQLCIPHFDDDISCEEDITGSISLINSSEVAIISPASATIVVQDDDRITATFGQSMYLLREGIADQELYPFINSSASPNEVQLLLESVPLSNQLLNVERSIFFTGNALTSPLHRQPLGMIIRDDDVALEDTEVAVLELRVSPESSCSRVTLSPFNVTTISIIDNDVVIIGLTETTGRTKEGEDYRVCISASKVIARELLLSLEILSSTANLDDIDPSYQKIDVLLLPMVAYNNKCYDIPILQDNIIEQSESFMIKLAVNQTLPAGVRNNLVIRPEVSTVTIMDTSTCLNYDVSPADTVQSIYIAPDRTLCFTCETCSSSNISWSVISYDDYTWKGLTGGRLHSSSNMTDRGVVFANGTLLITNSTTLFSKTAPGTINFSEQISGNADSGQYTVQLGDPAKVVSLNIVQHLNTYRLICEYQGTPEPSVEWLVDQMPFEKNEDISEVENDSHYLSILTLSNVTSVQYACRVSNSFGEDASEGSISQDNTTASINSSRKLCITYIMYILGILFYSLT